MKHTLEQHRLFPFVAWGLVIGFALFVGYLSIALNTEFNDTL